MNITTKLEIVISTIVAVMLIGTIAYHNLEGWSYVDSFYFTGITMTTIGYGDLHPTTEASKIFTVFFAFGGVGISLFALSLFASTYFERREKAMSQSLIESIKNSRKTLAKKRKEIIEGSEV